MANTITEQAPSGRLTMGKPGELSSYTRVWLVTSTGTGGDVTDSIGVSQLSSLPRAKYSRLSTTPATIAKRFVCQSVDVEPIKDRAFHWMVRATYTTRYNPDACFVKITRSGGERIMDRWRADGAPSNGDCTWPPANSTVLSGTPLDMRGSPKRQRIGQQQIVIETLLDAAVQASVTANKPYVDYQTINATYRGFRNSVAFQGWDIGKVVFQGCDESTVDDNYRMVSYRFLADDLFHLEQRVVPEPSGKALIATTQTWADGTVILCASKVYWYQQFDGTKVNFLTGLFTGCQQSELTGPQPAFAAE